jgi:2-hydroxy-3-keto-5-methylthiopentenyl-1-phosphate phosphatase
LALALVADVLCLDFDDTIVLDNMARAVFERFASEGWRGAEAQYHQGEMSVEQFNAAALDLIPAETPREELEAFAVEHARVRHGLPELVDWAHWNDWQVVVVSNGFDFYVDPMLDALGLDRVARHCGRTRAEYRWRVRYDSPRGIEVIDRFKLAYAAAFRAAGDFVAYIGDGASDVEAARLAPVVFARSTLLERLEGEHPRVYAFETFDDVRDVLEREAAGWPREAKG